MRSELAILLLLTSVAQADKVAAPRAQASELKLAKSGETPVKVTVTRVQVKETRSTDPCAVQITVEMKHTEFRSLELDFAFRRAGGPPTPLAVKAATAKHGGAAGKGHIAVSPAKAIAGYATKFGAEITAGGVKWQLEGSMGLANVGCVSADEDPG